MDLGDWSDKTVSARYRPDEIDQIVDWQTHSVPVTYQAQRLGRSHGALRVLHSRLRQTGLLPQAQRGDVEYRWCTHDACGYAALPSGLCRYHDGQERRGTLRCAVCPERHYARGWCMVHYKRAQRRGMVK